MGAATERGIVSQEQLYIAQLEEMFGQGCLERVRRSLVDLCLFTPDAIPSFNFPPETHEYPDGSVSGMQYLVDGYVLGNEVIYLGFMEPNNQTTRHKHGTKETYHVLAGGAEINGIPISDGVEFTVNADVWHQLKTKDRPVIAVMISHNMASVPPEQRHIMD